MSLTEALKIALDEVGTILPWWEDDVSAFVFEHAAYPVSCAGETAADVIRDYPLYLQAFLTERLNNNLAPQIEAATLGRGGRRLGAGRPAGRCKEPTKMVRLPVSIANWIKQDPENLRKVQNLMQA